MDEVISLGFSTSKTYRASFLDWPGEGNPPQPPQIVLYQLHMDPCDCEGLQTSPRWAVAHHAQTLDTWNEAQRECTPWMLLITNETTLPARALRWERMWDERGSAIPPSLVLKSIPGQVSLGILDTWEARAHQAAQFGVSQI